MATAIDTNVAVLTLAEAKEYLKITTSAEDVIISHLVNAVSQWINGYLNRHLVSKAHVEYYSGDGSLELVLKNYPIISITSVFVDDQRLWPSSSEVVAANMIVKKDSGILRAFNLLYGWQPGESNIKISYTAGYTVATSGSEGGGVTSPGTMPYDIRLAAKLLLDRHFRIGYSNRKLDFSSESISGMNITFKDNDIPKDAKLMLDKYKSKMVCTQYEYAD